jgi:predicted ABC-type ATPase
VIESALDKRPAIVAVAGPNGAGKTTFFSFPPAGSRVALHQRRRHRPRIETTSYEAAGLADAPRRELVRQRESFVFETVFSDPIRDKLTFLTNASAAGSNVVLCFIGISGRKRGVSIQTQTTKGTSILPND